MEHFEGEGWPFFSKSSVIINYLESKLFPLHQSLLSSLFRKHLWRQISTPFASSWFREDPLQNCQYFNAITHSIRGCHISHVDVLGLPPHISIVLFSGGKLCHFMSFSWPRFSQIVSPIVFQGLDLGGYLLPIIPILHHFVHVDIIFVSIFLWIVGLLNHPPQPLQGSSLIQHWGNPLMSPGCHRQGNYPCNHRCFPPRRRHWHHQQQWLRLIKRKM